MVQGSRVIPPPPHPQGSVQWESGSQDETNVNIWGERNLKRSNLFNMAYLVLTMVQKSQVAALIWIDAISTCWES